MQRAGRLEEALAAYDTALRHARGHANALFSRGNVLRLLGRREDAVKAFDRLLAAQPDNAEALAQRAYVHMEREDHAAALTDFERVLRLRPGLIEAMTGRAAALFELRRFDEALAAIDAVVAAEPARHDALLVRGQVLAGLDRNSEALDLVDRLPAGGGAKGQVVRATALWRLGRRHEAIAAAEAALRQNEDVQLHQALAHYYLTIGDFARGWQENEFRAGVFDRGQAGIERRAPRWTGEDVAGKTVLVMAEQGIGDSIQFARFLGVVHGRGATVKMLVQPAFAKLARSLPVPVEWIDRASAAGAFDYQIPLMSLPHVFGTALDSLPGEVPYLFADREAVTSWRARIGSEGFRVGINWQGNPKYKNDRRRSVPLAFFAPLAAITGVRLISLQAVHGLDQLERLPAGMDVETLGETITANPDGMAEVAAVMESLDLVVTSDTAVAHLAGALGRPVWVALSDDPDWRWMADRADSPWYPTMRLFRQTVRDDWAGVFAEIAAAIREKMAPG